LTGIFALLFVDGEREPTEGLREMWLYWCDGGKRGCAEMLVRNVVLLAYWRKRDFAEVLAESLAVL
jgi:hypothetical protein